MKRIQPQPRDEAHAAALRLRSAAPVLAFTVPVVLLVVAGAVSASSGDDAALSWVVAASRMTALMVFLQDGASPGLGPLLITAIASAPLWSLLGLTVAGRTGTFGGFWRWYLVCSVAWVVAALVLVPT